MKDKIVILGAGESGVGAAILANAKGYDVFVSDKEKVLPKYAEELNAISVAWEQEQHSEDKILSASEIIKSPGIPDTAPLLKLAKSKGIPILSEIEFAGRYSTARHIGITGTNGKTTTTMLTWHILQKAGLNVGIGGNIGKSFARQVAEKQYEYFVLELSSFQLDGIENFKCDIGVLCNITPDHLDRYDYKLENYIQSKFRIAKNQTEADVFVYCEDDELTLKWLDNNNIKSKLRSFSIKKKPANGAYVHNGTLNLTTNEKNILTMNIQELSLRGIHNSYNSMAAAIVANALNIRKEIIRESLTDFQSVEHRLEFVATVRGVEYINDSKATNVNSAWFALESMEKPVVWIVGGVDKGNDYASLIPLVQEKVKMIVCLGTDNRKIHEAFGKYVDIMINTTSAKEAVHVAQKFADKGDVVLLSPACASFDLFQNYEDRGWQYKHAVREL